METNAIAISQPYIFKLTRMGMAATLAGGGLDFLDQVSRILWDGTVDDWDKGTHLVDAVTRAGLDHDALARQIETEPDHLDALIKRNQEAHDVVGHWGVPTMVFRGEPFFGQDRVDLLRWRVEQSGVATRP